MTPFQKMISERLRVLTQSRLLEEKRAQYTRSYAMPMTDDEGNKVTAVSDFLTAFIDLLNERYSLLSGEMEGPLHQRFREMYAADGNEDAPDPKKELSLHNIKVPSETSDSWELQWEMQSDDTIFHTDFEGWEFKRVGVTH